MLIRFFQKGFNYSQDGPGNRLVYHLQGCNMRCPWCANPEGLDAIGGQVWDTEAMLCEAVRSRSMFFEGGGVTFTGGEPTLQFQALYQLLRGLRENGIDTALETNASHPRLYELFPYIDHLMMDFKQPFNDRHLAATGIGNEVVLDNLRRACAEHPDVSIRIPLINGYNASQEDMLAFAKTLSAFVPSNVGIEPLRYHEYGLSKWEQLGLPYTIRNGHISDKQLHSFLQILHDHSFKIVRT